MERVLTGLVAGALTLLVVLAAPPLLLRLAAMALLAGLAAELVRLGRLAGSSPVLWLLPLVAVVTAAVAWWLVEGPVTAPQLLLAGPLAFALVTLLARSPAADQARAIGWFSFGMPYLLLPILALVALAELDRKLLLSLLVAVWLTDSAAYFAGSRWGKHRMAPRLSPKKTWEGALAGLLAAAVWSGVAASLWYRDDAVVVIAALVASAVGAQLGDLVESQLKRAVGVKDSGNLLPGHGGLLDRLDAILVAAPVFYLLLRWGDWSPHLSP